MRTAKNRPPKLGRPAGRFTQIRRLDKLRTLLEKSPIGVTLEEIAATLKITERSARRYLRELDGSKPDQMYDLLESVETRRGGPLRWRIKPSERGRAVSLRRAQAYALLSTRPALEILRGSALYEEADLALAQIAKIAQTPFRVSQRAEISGEQNLEDRFLFVPPAGRSYSTRGEDLDELFRAVADLRVLRYRPRQRASDARADRIAFQPYAMVVHRGAIVLVGASTSPDAEIEVLPFETMSDVRTSETEHFRLPPGFDVADFVHGELGVGRPARSRFMVEFESRVADEVKTRRFHPKQRVGTAPDGRVRLSLPLVDTRAAVAFVLAWGDAAKVIDPPELADEVGTILARAASRYRESQ